MTYDDLLDSINVDAITQVTNSNLSDHDKRKLIAYILVRNNEGCLFEFPTKKHKTHLAELMIRNNLQQQEVVSIAGISVPQFYILKGRLQ